MLNYLRYRYAKARMAAFVDGQLPQNTRRFVARLIDEDPRCYQEYIRLRENKQTLERDLPRLGRPDAGTLDALWHSIEQEMTAPADPAPAATRQRYAVLSLRYGVGVLLLLWALILPALWSGGTASPVQSMTRQPSPVRNITLTPATAAQDTPEAAPTLVALMAQTETHATAKLETDLHNTPASATPQP